MLYLLHLKVFIFFRSSVLNGMITYATVIWSSSVYCHQERKKPEKSEARNLYKNCEFEGVNLKITLKM